MKSDGERNESEASYMCMDAPNTTKPKYAQSAQDIYPLPALNGQQGTPSQERTHNHVRLPHEHVQNSHVTALKPASLNHAQNTSACALANHAKNMNPHTSTSHAPPAGMTSAATCDMYPAMRLSSHAASNHAMQTG